MSVSEISRKLRTTYIAAILTGMAILSGCSAADKENSGPGSESDATYLRLAPAGTFGAESSESRLQPFASLFSDLDKINIQQNLDKVYAEQLYFNDTFHTFSDREQLKQYLLGMADVSETKVTVLDSLASGNNIIVRWKMNTQSQVWWKTLSIDSIGMTHLRLNAQGKIILHQDYWDAAGGFYEYLPLLGTSIRSIRTNLKE